MSLDTFEKADSFCHHEFGGYLADGDTQEELDFLKTLINEHATTYSPSTFKYLINLIKLDTVDNSTWSFNNALPLGSFMPWHSG